MSLLLWLDLVYQSNKNIYEKAAFFLLSILFSLSIGYSRLWLGVHSLDQILFGYMLGIWIACFMYFCVKNEMITHFNKLFGAATTDYRGLVTKSAFVFLVTMGVQMLNYSFFSPRITINPYWIE